VNDCERRDRKLVADILLGDEHAFNTFVDEYYPRLYRFAYPRVARNPDAAQDLVQGTFEKVIPKLAYYRGEAALFSWLCSFCRYEIAAHWRKVHRREPEVELREDAPELRAALESLAMCQEGPATRVERAEIARLVRVALDHLPVHYGNVLEWKYLQGHSVRHIADRMGLSVKAAESLLTRARHAFRDAFGELVGGWTS
jgi:RNA polymerase sigma-70 factor (ECF subfamily)